MVAITGFLTTTPRIPLICNTFIVVPCVFFIWSSPDTLEVCFVYTEQQLTWHCIFIGIMALYVVAPCRMGLNSSVHSIVLFSRHDDRFESCTVQQQDSDGRKYALT